MTLYNNELKITLESILNVKNQYYDDFTIYLHHTYCIENLYFWQDVQHYRIKPTFTKYKTMIENYIIPNAPHEINIPCDMRQAVLDYHTPHCFDQAAESVLELIRVNSFLPWYQDHFLLGSVSTTHRNSLSSPSDFINKQHTRPSFSSLRAPSSHSLFHFDNHSHNKLTSLFQRKRQALMIRMKNAVIDNKGWTNNSWLAKK